MMIRRPLRPIARVIAARQMGENPDIEEARARMARARNARAKQQNRIRARIALLGLALIAAFAIIGGRMVLISLGGYELQAQAATNEKISSERAEIFDRNGRLLATNVTVPSIYARTSEILDPVGSATKLATIFPDLDAVKWAKKLSQERKFYWIKRRVSPEQAQAVFNIGDPGLMLGKRQVRVYPMGPFAAHVLGFAGFGHEDIHAAQVVGRDGVELWFDRALRGSKDKAPVPLQLSIDSTIQYGVRTVLAGGMKMMNAKGASAILLDATSGEVLSLVSLPDFDPNTPPATKEGAAQEDNPIFNRASQGLYELGSTYKLFTAATAIEAGIATPDTLIDTKPFRWGSFPIGEMHGRSYAPYLSLTNVLVKSSNVGSANLAKEFGTDAQKTLFAELGLLHPTSLELGSAKITHPIKPRRWSDTSTITISYGHGLSATPLHLAAAYASLLNGGVKIDPTLVKGGNAGKQSIRVVSEKTSNSLRYMLRKVVTDGSGHGADVPGYEVAGKTGTANKPDGRGGYHKNKVMANFAAVFPASDPKYVLVVALDEPEYMVGGEPKRSASWTAAPIAGGIIRRIGPLLGAVSDNVEHAAAGQFGVQDLTLAAQ
jgi:cell division protein FtsI (penicillin-binding protein 3)